MSEVAKDHSIKLFGKTIDLFPFNLVQNTTLPEQIVQGSSVTSTSQDTKDLSRGEATGSTHESESANPTDEASSEISEEVAPPPCPNKDSLSQESSNKKEEPNDSTASDEKTLKKPEEILPCPRCESMDTKFCYFNNYNVNQPRYFCRKCQRYWTCGGTMRNVPIGSGRRKNKNNVAIQNYYRHITVQENGAHLNPNGFLILDEGSNKSYNTPLNSTENGFPVTFYPATSYWGSAVPSSFWNVPWLSPPTYPVSSVLGKHPREATTIRPSVLVPKSLRIDDSNEAAKGSTWSSCIFKPFEPKGTMHRSVDNTAMALQSNPAALLRSHNFHETA